MFDPLDGKTERLPVIFKNGSFHIDVKGVKVKEGSLAEVILGSHNLESMGDIRDAAKHGGKEILKAKTIVYIQSIERYRKNIPPSQRNEIKDHRDFLVHPYPCRI